MLAPMRFKSFVWPHNPKTYEIEFKRRVAVHNVPFGSYVLQDLGRTNRAMRGEGAFVGAGAYAKFQELACLFFENTPGILVHPLWQTANAYLVSLKLLQEPTENFVKYSFEFWESFDGYAAGIRATERPALSYTASGGIGAGARARYVVRAGENLWVIAAKNSMSAAKIIALNPQIKNPNIIRAGDVIYLS